MSERSFRRDRERRIAAEQRRETHRVRRAAAAAAAAGAFALAAPAVSAAATFTVNSTGDTGADNCAPDATPAGCELRDAIGDASALGGADTIVFDSSISGDTVTLNSATGPLVVDDNDPLTIYGGPTPDSIYISGDYATMVFDVVDTYTGPDTRGLTLSGLTIQDGDGLDNPAGGILVEPGDGGPYLGTDVLLTNSTVSGNEADGDEIGNYSSYLFAAGGGIANAGRMTVENSTISGNDSNASGSPFPKYGGGGIDNLGRMDVTDSTITGNFAQDLGGGIFNGYTNAPTSLSVSNTTISDNRAFSGGGVAGSSFFGPDGSFLGTHGSIVNSTVSGNHSYFDGGGVELKYLGASARWTISHTTISGNEAYGDESNGGGISVGYQTGRGYNSPTGYVPLAGTLNVVDSTVSGNYATAYGGGAMIASNAQKYDGTVQVNNSTVASNLAGYYGGGLALGYTGDLYDLGDTPLFSTIVGDNLAGEGSDANDPNDLGQTFGILFGAKPQAAGPGAFDLSFSLVEQAGNAPFTETPAGSNIFGVDPQLGGLANNGGPTLTQLPSINSPVVDKGSAPGNLTTDQRGLPRTVDTSVANAKDGTDIGSVELPAGPPGPPPPPAAGGTKVGTLKKKHKKRRRVIRTKNKVAKVRITFRSSNTGVTFQCSVDGSAFSPCKSPFVTKLRSASGKGKKHNIAIKQVDAAGNQIGNVRVFKFRVVLKD
jgi:hypothetical protein